MDLKFRVQNYATARQVLIEYLAHRQAADPQFSLRGWARELGFRSHTLLHFFIKGKRPIRPHHVDVLAKGMKLSKKDSAFFGALVKLENSSTVKDKTSSIRALIDKQGVSHKVKVLEEFKLCSSWLHMAILACGKFNQKSLLDKFSHRASSQEIEAAVYRLAQFGLIKEDASGWEVIPDSVLTRNDIVDLGSRTFIKEACVHAAEAIDEQQLDIREFQSFSLAVAPEKIPLAKELIRNFRREFNALVGGDGEHIYHTNLQFYRLSKVPSRSEGSRKVATEKQQELK